MNKIYDAIFIGSGFSTRYLIDLLNKENLDLLLINHPKKSITKNGIIHPEGNIYINHKIRLSSSNINILKSLQANQSVNISLKTNPKKRPRLSKYFRNIKYYFIDIEKIDIIKSHKKKYILNINNSLIKFETNYLFFAASLSTLKILNNTNLESKSYFSEIEKKSINEMNNFSTIIPINKNRIDIFNLEESDSQCKNARFSRLKNDIYYHIYLKKFTFNSFKKEWDIAFFSSLIKNKYLVLIIKYVMKRPIIFINLFLKLFKKKKYALYLSLESNNDFPSFNEVTEVKNDLLKNYEFNEYEINLLNKAFQEFTCNSHYHSNIRENKYKNIFIIGSPSIDKTFSANPTGFILEQIIAISERIKI